MKVRLRYRGVSYEIHRGSWRGADGRGVHLLTWITDDLGRSAARADDDRATAAAVAERLGPGASVEIEDEKRDGRVPPRGACDPA